ncbi:MAG: hypothetical protein G01um101433_640 [Parcubacteria group bacterium Gr01-1014_33]|nr:MAG: hypothetical protein G01um101433_640 [Parcubacteria group bacterium Gr01-1014_33]
MNIISHKYTFLAFSGILVAASIFAIAFWGLKLGIDFTGGTRMEIEFERAMPSVAELKNALSGSDLAHARVELSGEKRVSIKAGSISEAAHQDTLVRLAKVSRENKGGEIKERRFDAIGPVIGRELKIQSLIALVTAAAAIIIYIAWSFRHVSKPVASWKYGIAAVLALCHDVIIPTGVFAVLGHFQGVEVDSLFITALLTIMGFSVHDTIVVFDRTRENLRALRAPDPFGRTVNKSVNETISRSVNTSLTVLLVLSAIFFFGGETTRFFSLALVIGIVFGTYSSIFVASPLLIVWQELSARLKK